MRRTTATFALAFGLADCGSSAPLMTVDAPNGINCILSYSVVDVVADPTLGTVDKTSGKPLLWVSGYTGRWAGPQIEVLDPDGKIVLKTGGRYRISPAYVNPYPDGPTAVCAPVPCPECELGSGGAL